MRTGIFGGTFDPIHLGHVDAAERAMAALGLDRMLVLPSGKPPYKRCHAPRADRMRMVELALEGRAGLVPCDVEIARKGESYTAETLKALRAAHPDDDFTLVIGADQLDTLDRWYQIGKIAAAAEFAVIGRPGRDAGDLPARARALSERLGARIALTGVTGADVSSGVVRSRVAAGEAIDGLVPAGVARYIRERGLYLCDYTETKLLDRLRATLTLHRYHHTLGVAETAQRLAPRYGVDPMRARLAGLLHDCAKSLPYGEMRSLVEAGVPDADALELDSEPVLHAPAGMVLARRDYGVRDPSILQAIRRHTLGGPNMTAMDAVIYVSDFIEPGRRPFDGLARVRAAAETDIFEAMRLCASLTSDYLTSRGATPHPRTLQVLEQQ